MKVNKKRQKNKFRIKDTLMKYLDEIFSIFELLNNEQIELEDYKQKDQKSIIETAKTI